MILSSHAHDSWTFILPDQIHTIIMMKPESSDELHSYNTCLGWIEGSQHPVAYNIINNSYKVISISETGCMHNIFIITSKKEMNK